MHNIINNQFGQQNIRIIMIDGEPWFVAKDIADVLGYTQTQVMLKRMDEDEMSKVKASAVDGLSKRFGNNDIAVVNESGLYSALIRSYKPEAKVFKKWVTSEVLPAIRKTGGYSVQHQIPQTYEEAVRAAGKAMLDHADALKQLAVRDAVIEEQKPKIETYNEIMDLDYIYDMNTAVKMIDSATKLGIGRNIMFRILRDKKILIGDRWVDYKGDSHYKNQPYQKYVNAGYFIVRPGKNRHCQSQTFMTMRGVEFIAHLLLSMSLDEIGQYMARAALMRNIGRPQDGPNIHGLDEPYYPDSDSDSNVEVDAQMSWDEEYQ